MLFKSYELKGFFFFFFTYPNGSLGVYDFFIFTGPEREIRDEREIECLILLLLLLLFVIGEIEVCM